MKSALIWFGAIAAGLALGTALALLALAMAGGGARETARGWAFDSNAGSNAPALAGSADAAALLMLSGREARTYVRDRDDDGELLNESCVYALEGGPIPARWWSATLYAKDDFLAHNPDNAFSTNSTRLGALAQRNWAVRLAPVRGEANAWLSTREGRAGFKIALRVYHASRSYRDVEAALPNLRRVSCSGRGP